MSSCNEYIHAYLDSDEYEKDQEFQESVYEFGESSSTKYNLVLCELYDVKLHGVDTSEAQRHFLTQYRLKGMNMYVIEQLQHLMGGNPKMRLEIAEVMILPSQHCVSILKTYWLSIIQRCWKKRMQMPCQDDRKLRGLLSFLL